MQDGRIGIRDHPLWLKGMDVGFIASASPGRELRANPDVCPALKAFKVGGIFAVKKGGTAGAPRPFEDGRADFISQ